jgi:FeS assembly SUF system protein
MAEKREIAQSPESPVTGNEDLEAKITAALRTVYDPEIPVNIYEIGLVYGIDIDPAGAVVVRMTLTSPGCPVAVSLPLEVEAKVQTIPGVTSARVDLVWDPPWNPEMMSEAARLELGFF